MGTGEELQDVRLQQPSLGTKAGIIIVSVLTVIAAPVIYALLVSSEVIWFSSAIPYSIKGLIPVLIFCTVLAKPLRKNRLPFYIFFFVAFVFLTWFRPFMWFAPVGVGPSSSIQAVYQWYEKAVYGTHFGFASPAYFFTSGTVATAFFLVVMGLGAVDNKNRWVKNLTASRTEISVIASFVLIGHIFRIFDKIFVFKGGVYSSADASQLTSRLFTVAFTFCGITLTVLFIPLFISSFWAVRNRMTKKAWDNLQKLAYPFYFFMIAFGIIGSAGWAISSSLVDDTGQLTAAASDVDKVMSAQLSTAGFAAGAWLYAAYGLLYLIARLNKHYRDKAQHEQRKAKYASMKRSAADVV